MIEKSEIASLIYLLDDNDTEVVEHVTSKLLSFGNQLIPIIEENWSLLDSIVKQERVENLIKKIQSQSLESNLRSWVKSDERDLLEGLILINKLYQPEVNITEVNKMLDKIRLDVWLELRDDLTSFEKVKILNYIFYDIHKFKGNTEDYHNPKNSFIYNVLESTRIVGLLLLPILPNLSSKIDQQLGLLYNEKVSWEKQLDWGKLIHESILPAPNPVIEKLEYE